jgi:hypothetical protein
MAATRRWLLPGTAAMGSVWREFAWLFFCTYLGIALAWIDRDSGVPGLYPASWIGLRAAIVLLRTRWTPLQCAASLVGSLGCSLSSVAAGVLMLLESPAAGTSRLLPIFGFVLPVGAASFAVLLTAVQRLRRAPSASSREARRLVLHIRVALGAAAVTAFVMALRTETAWMPVQFVVYSWVLAAFGWWRSAPDRQQCVGLALAGLALAVGFVPVLWLLFAESWTQGRGSREATPVEAACTLVLPAASTGVFLLAFALARAWRLRGR